MRVLIISQYFAPDVTAAAYRVTDSMRLLGEMGHQLRVITSTPHKDGFDSSGLDGLQSDHIIRIPVSRLKKFRVKDYLAQYFGFIVRAVREALLLRRQFDYEVVWVTSPPLSLAIPGIILRFVAGRPVVFDVRDIWPESAVAVGKIKRGSIIEVGGRLLERLAYRFPNALTCVSQPMARYLEQLTRRPVTVIYNGVPNSQIREMNGAMAGQNKVFSYAGNLGYAQGIGDVLKAFALAARDPALLGAELWLIGSGVLETSLQSLTANLNLGGKVHFLGVRSKAETLELMRRSSVLLIPLVESPAFELTVPSKVFDCMAVGRPVLASLRGEGAEILNETGANIVVVPGDVEELAEAMIKICDNWLYLNEKAQLNVELVGAKFTRESAVRILDAVLKRAAVESGKPCDNNVVL